MAGLGHRRQSPTRAWRRLRDGFRLRGEAEVFPWMEHAVAVGATLGAGLGLVVASRLGWDGPMSVAAVAATSGAACGLTLALGWAASPRPIVASPAAGPRDLWDAWLDDRRIEAVTVNDEPDPAPPLETVVVEARAPVRPRTRSRFSGDSMPLEDEVGSVLAARERGAIRITGPPGAGKTTALAYLANRVPAHFRVTFLDDPGPRELRRAAAAGLVVFASSEAQSVRSVADFPLAPWGRDEWIEFLLAGDRAACASVMARLGNRAEDHGWLGGNPELWRVVLDRMAEDPGVAGPRMAIRAELDRHLIDPARRAVVERDCLAALLADQSDPPRPAELIRRPAPDDPLLRLIRHRPVRVLLATGCLVDELSGLRDGDSLSQRLPRDLVDETATRLVGRASATERLRTMVADPAGPDRHPMAASLLHALGSGWRPDAPPPRLAGAYLDGASWANVVLTGANLVGVDLRRSRLDGAVLDRALLRKARLDGANLRSASLHGADLVRAEMRRAILDGAEAQGANLEGAVLEGASLEGAKFDWAILAQANLTDARLARANLSHAILSGATLDRADLTGADLSFASLLGLNLTGTELEGAKFVGALLTACNMEGVVLPDANFRGAKLDQALLTASRMPNADFRDANLRAAGLAEIDWEAAILRRADLREVAFHLGSSRSGLVGSPIASEGSRTGFYTDDYNDREFKNPEEIRKANLRGADLRGARIDGVDFYLVDLRGARFDAEHLPHLRRCGAILGA